MMGFFSLLVVFLFVFSASPSFVDAVSGLNHPQVQFCSAGFVLRGVVLTADLKRNAYTIKVISLFKDEIDLSQAEGTQTRGARLKLRLYNSPYSFPLGVGNVYVLAGQLDNGKLRVRRTDYIFPFPTDNEWKNVSPTQKYGLSFRYKQGCKCRIGRCYGNRNCLQKVPGCEFSELEKRPRFDVCRMKHQFCEMRKNQRRGGAERCRWETRKTNDFRNCDRTP